MRGFILILSFYILFISKNYFLSCLRNIDFSFYILLILISSFFLISSNDLLIIFISIELISLSSYILIGFNRNSFISIEGSLKYFILGGISTVFFALGIGFIYLVFGTTDLILIKQLILLCSIKTYTIFNFFFLGTLFICTSFFFKLGLVPFHFWLIDAYEGGNILTTFFLIIIPKFSIFYTFFKNLVYN